MPWNPKLLKEGFIWLKVKYYGIGDVKVFPDTQAERGSGMDGICGTLEF
jgi:hypothetical protein